MQQAVKRGPPNTDKITISKETLTTVTSHGHSQEKEDRKSVCAPVQIQSNSNILTPPVWQQILETHRIFFRFILELFSVELTSKFHFFCTLVLQPCISVLASPFFILLIFKTL